MQIFGICYMFMHACMHTQITNTHTYWFSGATHIYTKTYIYVYTCMHAYANKKYTHTYWIFWAIHIHIYKKVHVTTTYTNIYTYIYIYIINNNIYTRQMPVANCNSVLNRDSLCLDCWEILSTNTKLQNISLVQVALAQRILEKMICYKEPCL